MSQQADGPDAARESCRLRLRILATTDLHAHVQPYDYFHDQPHPGHGLASVANLIEKLRNEVPNCLLFDNGDTLQGTPYGDFLALEHRRENGPHSMIAAMNALGYDAATLGNHDFNFGLDFLRRTLSSSHFPHLLANVTMADGSPFLPGHALLVRECLDRAGKPHSLRIGVIGLTPPQITQWDRQVLGDALETQPIVTTAMAEAESLRRDGADLVIALCHSGIGAEQDRPDLENAIVPLANCGAVDAIVAGHTHSVLPIPGGRAHLGSVPVVQAGFFGSHLGLIDLDLEQSPTGWQLRQSHACALPVHEHIESNTPPHPAVIKATERDHAETLKFIRRRIGESLSPVNSYFALIANCAAVQLVTSAQRSFAEELLQQVEAEGLPLLSVAAPFKSGGRGGPLNYTDIPQGPIALRHAADLYVFPNTLQVLQIRGGQIRRWLERSASGYHQIEPGRPGQILIDPYSAGYNFDVFDGLTYQIDLSVPALFSPDGEKRLESPGRIRELRHQGRPVADDDSFFVATNSYRASGGGHYRVASECPVVAQSPTSVLDILIRHLSKISPFTPEARPIWKFAPMPGTSVIFETGPGAKAQYHLLEQHNLRMLDLNEQGFLRFDLAL